MRSCLVLIFLLCSVEIVAAETTVFDAQDLDPIVVTASRTEEPLREQTYSIGVIDRYALQLIGHTHVNELGFRIPGVWFSRGNGQEHLTAIRSPVLTGAGACGAFLYLEDGIPIRPAGFCNVNELSKSIPNRPSRSRSCVDRAMFCMDRMRCTAWSMSSHRHPV